jgi:hypothetical protein
MKNPGSTDKRSVYFVQAVGAGDLVKIGVAGDVKVRLLNLQCACPLPIRHLATIPGGGMDQEWQLHRRFAAARRHGEWFEPTPELMAYIAEVQATTFPGPVIHRGFHAQFERQLDAWGVTDPVERKKRGESLKKAYMARLTYRSVRARRLAKEAKQAA